MNSTPLKVAMCLSLLVHGAVLSMVYGLWHEPNGALLRCHAERSLVIEINSAPESQAPSPPVPVPAKIAEISKPELPVVPPLALPETKSTASTFVPPVPPEKRQSVEVVRAVPASFVEPENKIAPPVSPNAGASSPGPARTVDVGVNYFLNPHPDYPAEARRRKEQGLVVLAVQVSREGIPGQIQVVQSSKFQALDEAAVRAVSQWRFTPAKHGDLTVPSQIQVPIRFRLSIPKSNAPDIAADGEKPAIVPTAQKQ